MGKSHYWAHGTLLLPVRGIFPIGLGNPHILCVGLKGLLTLWSRPWVIPHRGLYIYAFGEGSGALPFNVAALLV